MRPTTSEKRPDEVATVLPREDAFQAAVSSKRDEYTSMEFARSLQIKTPTACISAAVVRCSNTVETIRMSDSVFGVLTFNR
jgi:hypothetical protein